MSKNQLTDAIVVPKDYIGFDQIAFALAALSKDETRHILTYMQVLREGVITRFIATDGHRLHLAELDLGLFDDDVHQLDQGLYSLISKSTQNIVIRKSEEPIATYPKWQAVTGDYQIGDPLAEICHITDPGKIGEIMIRTSKLVDTIYLTQALGYGFSRKAKESAHIQFQASTEENGMLTIAHDHGTAFVMPLRRAEPDEIDKEDENSPTHITDTFSPLKETEENVIPLTTRTNNQPNLTTKPIT